MNYKWKIISEIGTWVSSRPCVWYISSGYSNKDDSMSNDKIFGFLVEICWIVFHDKYPEHICLIFFSFTLPQDIPGQVMVLCH